MKYKCLIVDDHKLMRHMIAQSLDKLQIQDVIFSPVEHAEDGSEALSKLEDAYFSNEPVDIVFLDWNMPVMNGYALLVKCRQDEKYNSTAFVMLTAESEQQMVVKAIKAGATSYICKPFSVDDLKERIDAIITWVQNKKMHLNNLSG